MTPPPSPAQTLVARLMELFATFPQVRAITLGGSQATGEVDSQSDIDLYVYYTAPLMSLSQRQALVVQAGGARQADLGLEFWGPGDEWFDTATGIEVDVVYFEVAWFEEQMRRLWVDCEPGLGYTTCLWYTLASAQLLHDPRGWLSGLQSQAPRQYPERLRQAIVAKNRPVLRQVIPAYLHQVEKAVRRADLVSVNHRLAALLASYFDILFAANRLLHPGEKQLVRLAQERCSRLPRDFTAEIEAVLQAAGMPGPLLLESLNALLDHLDELLREEGLIE